MDTSSSSNAVVTKQPQFTVEGVTKAWVEMQMTRLHEPMPATLGLLGALCLLELDRRDKQERRIRRCVAAMSAIAETQDNPFIKNLYQKMSTVFIEE